MKRFVSQKIRLIPIPHAGAGRSHRNAQWPKDAARNRATKEAHRIVPLVPPPPRSKSRTNSASPRIRKANLPGAALPFPLLAPDDRNPLFERVAGGLVKSQRACGNDRNWVADWPHSVGEHAHKRRVEAKE